VVKKKSKVSRRKKVTPPTPHRTGVTPPKLDPKQIPNHVALVMDGNGRWAKQRGLPRTAGHEAGEASLLDMVHGAIEIGVKELSAYAFSTENWRRSPEEVKFLMEFNRQVLRKRRDEMNDLGVKIRWVGREKRLWSGVLKELKEAQELTKNNKVLTLNMCDSLSEKSINKYLYAPQMSDVDLFLRSSGEQRTSNFLMWQSAYAEMVFLDVLWPDADRRTLWKAIEIYAERERRFGKA